jgi:hypothetical protein
MAKEVSFSEIEKNGDYTKLCRRECAGGLGYLLVTPKRGFMSNIKNISIMNLIKMYKDWRDRRFRRRIDRVYFNVDSNGTHYMYGNLTVSGDVKAGGEAASSVKTK